MEPTQSQPKIDIYFDASLLKDSSCFRRIWWRTVGGYRPGNSLRADNYKAGFANAVHYFMQDWYLGMSPKDAVIRGMKYYEQFNDKINWTDFEFRSTANFLKICLAYAKQYKDRTEDFQILQNMQDQKIIEYKFSIPIWENEKYRLILAGTVDLVCAYQGYPILLVDHKLDSMSKTEKSFFRQFDMDIQTMMYSKVYKDKLGLEEYPPVMINGIFCKKPTKKSQDAGLYDGVVFERSPIIQYSKEDMDGFEDWLTNKINVLCFWLEKITKENLKPSQMPVHERAACKINFGGLCEYFDVCKLPPMFHEAKLNGSFKDEKYNPLTFRD